jgi:hypothetical protein
MVARIPHGPGDGNDAVLPDRAMAIRSIPVQLDSARPFVLDRARPGLPRAPGERGRNIFGARVVEVDENDDGPHRPQLAESAMACPAIP